jgi:hypothetical protein
MRKEAFLRIIMVVFLCVNLAVPSGLMAQGTKEEPPKQEGPAFRPEEIDQMVAPIALYPDELLAQVLAASTYPLEIVQAARFVQQNKDLKGEKLMQAAKDKDWDPSVKAMLGFPDVLLMMNEKLEWTEKLGNAVLSQQKDVMASAQRLRQKAYESGNLKTTKEQKVVVEEKTKVIVIQPANPEVVYVPAYNPTVVYGVWAYPAYPPPPIYPYGYAATAAFSFAAGVAVGAAWSGHGAYGCGWNSGEVDVNVNKSNNFTQNNYTNSQKYQKSSQTGQTGQKQNWQHNPEHRKGAQYPNQNTAQKYGQQRSGGGARATTSDARGYGSGGGQRGGGGEKGGGGQRGGGGPQTSDLSRGGDRQSAGDRGSSGGAQTSDLSRGGGKESAFGGGSGGSERASSNRGSESRSSASRSTSSAEGSRGSGSGGSRSSGGGSRGGSSGGGGRR